ncbi:hypothetical protein HpBT060_15150 [Helicobacter pylori]
MGNELLEAKTLLPHYCKLQKYLQRRAIIKKYSEACLGDLAPQLDSVELENATLILTFKDSDSVEAFDNNAEHFYKPRFRELYLESKRTVEKLGINSHLHFTDIKAKIKPIREPIKRAIFYRQAIKPINIDLTNHTKFTIKVFSKMIKQNNDRYLQRKT